MENMKPFLNIFLILLAIIGAAYALSSKFRSKMNKVVRELYSKIRFVVDKALHILHILFSGIKTMGRHVLSCIKTRIDNISRTAPKQPITDDQKILDIIVAIGDIYNAIEQND